MEESRRHRIWVSVAVSDRLDGDATTLAHLGVHLMRRSPDIALSDLSGLFDRVLIAGPNNFVRYAPLVRRLGPGSLVYLAEALFYRRMSDSSTSSPTPWNGAPRGGNARIPAARAYDLPKQTRSLRLGRGSGNPGQPRALPDSLWFDRCASHRTNHRPVRRTDQRVIYAWLARGRRQPQRRRPRLVRQESLAETADARPEIRLRVRGESARGGEGAGRPVSGVGRIRSRPACDLRGDTGGCRPHAVRRRRQGEVLEALQYGVPVVSTSVGAEGLGLHDSRAVVMTDDPHEFAMSLLRLYETRDAWEQQRSHILRVIERWRDRPERTWRQVFASSPGENRDAPRNIRG